MTRPIYLDNHATTPVDPRVLDAMLPYFTERFGNAASRSHAYGWEAEAAVDVARGQICGLIGGQARDLVLTSGATEANNLAIFGVTAAYASRGDHVVTVATEHKAVLDPCAALARAGGRVTVLVPDHEGLVTAEQVAAAVTDRTVLVSVMLANNEIGVLQPLAAIVEAVKAVNPKTLVHTDAAQAAGKLPLDVAALGVDLMSLSAHKLYGPKGVGALWLRSRPRVKVSASIHGGGHQRGMRSGTLDVPAIVGFGKACELAAGELPVEAARIGALRDRLQEGLGRRLDAVRVNGSRAHRLPGNLNMSFGYVEGEALLLALRQLAVSSGSACTSASLEPSYVLRAIGVDDEWAHASLRFGIGRFNTREHIDTAIDATAAAVERLRALSPAWRARSSHATASESSA